jgi:hypothetical protein
MASRSLMLTQLILTEKLARNGEPDHSLRRLIIFTA